jgi:hypothetical protein
MEQKWNYTDGVKLKSSEKICPSAPLPTTNPTWTALGVNLGLHDEKLMMTDCLSYSLAYCKTGCLPEKIKMMSAKSEHAVNVTLQYSVHT